MYDSEMQVDMAREISLPGKNTIDFYSVSSAGIFYSVLAAIQNLHLSRIF